MNRNKTLKISFSLKNTYRVNSILYGLRQIPLVKKAIPASLYGIGGLKTFATILSFLWEVLATFAGKTLYFLLMIRGAASFYGDLRGDTLFVHILFCLSVFGAFYNTEMFNPTRDKYYAMILMRMDARSYTLVQYGYNMIQTAIGFLTMCLIFGLWAGVPVWKCLLLPFSIVGMKLCASAFYLFRYEKSGDAFNAGKPTKFFWLAVLLALGTAYGLPYLGIVLPNMVVNVLLLLPLPAALWGIRKICSFSGYRQLYQQLLFQFLNQMDDVKNVSRDQSRKAISEDRSITSHKKGFEYLNELFIKRHHKILWKASKRTSACCLAAVVIGLLACGISTEIKETLNRIALTYLPYFTFIMYMVNRGTGFTQALFMNCDHSLLTYSFYKQPSMVLKLFRIRLREIIKINLPPAAILGLGLAAILYTSGGTESPLNYLVLFVSIICMSIFFSVHYLTIYYLLQPYTAGTEIKSGTYQLVMFVTYLVCFLLMKLHLPTLIFGLCTIGFCVLYCLVACILVYRLAPKTFRLRS